MNPQLIAEDSAQTPTAPGAADSTGRGSGSYAGGPLRATLGGRLLKRVLHSLGNPRVCIELPNGEVIETGDPATKPASRIRFFDWRAVWLVVTDPLFQFPEMYVAGRVEIDAPLEQVTVEIFRAIQHADAQSRRWQRLASLVHWPRGTSLRRARQNIHHHYDIGNDFYALWLDGRMAYTCAYFPSPDVSLEEAQIAKFDHVCRKARLQPGMHVIEAGCGWGGLALHMARQYGVTVQAYNISHQQICFARAQVEREGLADRVEFIEADWRMIRGTCDVFMSVGMLEHVGRRNYRLLGQLINRVLKPGGRGLIHSIGQNVARPASPWIERRIFPGGYPPSLSEMTRIFEPNGFSVLDIENIRLHYAQTLRHWLDRFRQNESRVREMFDERFVRMWRFYLAGSYAAFVTGSYQLFQVVFNRAADNDVSWTRAPLYSSPGVKPPIANPFAPDDPSSNR